MKRIELFLGTEKDKDGHGLFAEQPSLVAAEQNRQLWLNYTRDRVALLFGGVSMKELDGAWYNGKEIVTERAVSIVFFIDDFEIEKAIAKTKELAEHLCVFWNQGEVIWTSTDVEFEAVRPEKRLVRTTTGRFQTAVPNQSALVGRI